jgi:hypothetical protein
MSRTELIAFIDEKLIERGPVYAKADWIIDANGTVQETIQRIQELI